MIKGGYSRVVESFVEGFDIRLNNVVFEVFYIFDVFVMYNNKYKVIVSILNGGEYFGDVVLVIVFFGCLKVEIIKFLLFLLDWKYLLIK